MRDHRVPWRQNWPSLEIEAVSDSSPRRQIAWQAGCSTGLHCAPFHVFPIFHTYGRRLLRFFGTTRALLQLSLSGVSITVIALSPATNECATAARQPSHIELFTSAFSPSLSFASHAIQPRLLAAPGFLNSHVHQLFAIPSKARPHRHALPQQRPRCVTPCRTLRHRRIITRTRSRRLRRGPPTLSTPHPPL